ncbi:MAG: SDR family NAD(P)-dependent oxidoreductase, partial [Candidatus Odinarchaeia archaeon]
MDVLVTGGCGFIGANLTRALIKENYSVHVLDNLSNGKLDRLKDVIDQVKFYNVDITDLQSVKKVVSNVDVVFHLAAQVSVIDSMKNPVKDASVNITGSINILQSCVDYNVNKLILFSSAATYGEPQYLPIDENHPQNPESPYGLSKLVAEKYAQLYHKIYSLNTIIIRPFNVYGPFQDPTSP